MKPSDPDAAWATEFMLVLSAKASVAYAAIVDKAAAPPQRVSVIMGSALLILRLDPPVGASLLRPARTAINKIVEARPPRVGGEGAACRTSIRLVEQLIGAPIADC